MSNPATPTSAAALSRRRLLGLGLGAAAAIPFVGALSGCAGASTTGGGGAGTMQFFGTQFNLLEKQRYDAIIKQYLTDPPVSYTVAPSVSEFVNQIKTQVQANRVSFDLVGGLYGDLAPVVEQLEDLDDLTADATAAGVPAEMMTLGKLNQATQKFIPWMQATYVVAVNKKALEWLPSGADVNNLSYEQFLAWARAAQAANGGRGVFGLPCGPKGLYHRFFQGYLLPSFTGGQITTFAGADAETAWAYMKDLWAAMNPASTNYDSMQDPLARGEVLVAWDHVARLIDAPKDKPDDWLMIPAPTGPKGLGYMLIVAGLGIPKGGDREKASKTIKTLLTPDLQNETLKQNAFFPVIEGPEPTDLPPAVQLESAAVKAQQSNPRAIVALPPVGLGAKDAELGQAFKDTFTQICLQNRPIPEVLSGQAAVIAKMLDEAKVPCWQPDPSSNGQPCKVG